MRKWFFYPFAGVGQAGKKTTFSFDHYTSRLKIWGREKMKEEQKKVVLSAEQVEEMDKMADKVVEFADRFDELAEQTMNFGKYLYNLAYRFEAIDGEMSSLLSYLSDCFYDISEQNEAITKKFFEYEKGYANVSDYLAVQAENMEEQEIKKEEAKND